VSASTNHAMRIVAVSHYFPARKGGIEIVAHEINRRLAQRGHRVDWFASAGAELPAAQPNLHCHPMQTLHLVERLVGIPLPIWLGGGVPTLWSAIRQCDAVHIHDFIYPGSMLAMACAWWHAKPVVLTQHIGEIPYDSRLLSATLSLVNRVVGKFMLRRTAQVVFISNSVEAYFGSFVQFRRAPAYLPNGVNRALFHPADAAQRQAARLRLGIGDAATVCLFVGRFVEKKGLKLLHQLLPLTPDIEWIFAGHGPLAPSQSARVRVLDSLGHAELADLYRAADLLVLPSQGEGFPLVIQEAFACGLPAIVSDSTGAGCQAARPLLTELPVVGDNLAERWQTALTELAGDRPALLSRRAGVASFAAEHWDWDAAVDEYLKFYAAGMPRKMKV
jgi:phosphatidylinositol alpha-1,6-mannosyltransferase